tara:strand:- start:77 stop:634 length:558 start_codon:yes stop_codon:yes gene_type:complete
MNISKEKKEKIMLVKIGPYKDWVGPYQLSNLFKYFGISENGCDKAGDWLADTWINSFCNWIGKKRKRNIQVRIDDYDTWSMDSTLAYIILPMLKQLKEIKHGAPDVNDKDVPKKLRSTSAPAKENEWDTDDNWFDRWDWILDEMIWAFSQINKEPVTDKKELEAHQKRINRGFELFGKYYNGLWD